MARALYQPRVERKMLKRQRLSPQGNRSTLRRASITPGRRYLPHQPPPVERAILRGT
jgi:hypothetical protein